MYSLFAGVAALTWLFAVRLWFVHAPPEDWAAEEEEVDQ